MGGAMLSKSLIQFSIGLGRAVFPPCCLTWVQTMVEVMKKMATSFRRSHTHRATLRIPDPAAGHGWPTPPRETPGHSQASLDQSLVGSLLLSPGFWSHSVLFLCPPRVCFPSTLSSGSSMVGLMMTTSKKAYATPRSAVPRAPVPAAGHCWPVPLPETSTQRQVWFSLCGLSWYAPCSPKVDGNLQTRHL